MLLFSLHMYILSNDKNTKIQNKNYDKLFALVVSVCQLEHGAFSQWQILIIVYNMFHWESSDISMHIFVQLFQVIATAPDPAIPRNLEFKQLSLIPSDGMFQLQQNTGTDPYTGSVAIILLFVKVKL